MKDEHVVGGVALLAATAITFLWSVCVLVRRSKPVDLPDWSDASRWIPIVILLGLVAIVAIIVVVGSKSIWLAGVAAGVAVVAAVPLFTPRTWLEREGLALIVLWAVLAKVVAARWTRQSMRVVVALGVGFTLLLALRVGRTEIVVQRAADVRRAATALDSRRVEATASVAETSALSAQDGLAADSIFVLCDRASGVLARPDIPAVDPPRPRTSEVPRICTRKPGVPGTRSAQEAARVQAELDVAATEQQATPTPEHEAALEAAAAAVLSEKAGDQPEVSPSRIVDVLTTGGSRIAQAVPGVGSTDVPIALAVVGWTLLAGLILLGYRHLEIASSQRGRGVVTFGELVGSTKASTPAAPATPPPQAPTPPPAAVVATTTVPEEDGPVTATAIATAPSPPPPSPPPLPIAAMSKDELEVAFRRHVLMNVDEPGAIPGGESKDPVTDLLESSSDPVSKILASLLKIIRGLAATTPGYRVDATFQTITPEHPGEQTQYEVFVRVLRARTGATVRTKAIREETPTLAVRSAGYWTAAFILGCDRTSPSWARWDEAAAPAMATWDDAMASGASEDPAALREVLKQAARLAPASGLVLTRLANEYDMAGEHLEALELHLRTVTCHPRYPVARYRLAMSLGLVYATSPDWWKELDEPRRVRISRSIERSWDACAPLLHRTANQQVLAAIARLSEDARTGALPPDELRQLLDVIAEGFRRGAGQLVKRPMIMANAFRMSERRYWLPFVRPVTGRGVRHQLSQTMSAAQYVLLQRFGQTVDPATAKRRDQLESTVRSRDTWWQVAYNLACAHGIAAERATGADQAAEKATAVALLERLIELDGGGQLTQDWVMADPDLRSLQSDPAFLAFVKELPSELTRTASTSDS